ncbi:hypothetical protein BC834DRAFT_850678 [Gloeopeniophorella convolvens]|nr:hypothetical protein BC834DRAFT_850678 [Gloeopeniophorella convolvens]
MSGTRRGSLAPYVSRFVTLFNKLFEEWCAIGLTPTQINPKEGSAAFWSELLSLDVDQTYLAERLNAISKEECLDRLKQPLLVALKPHAVQMMTVLTRCLLSKSDLAGWEVMELFAGGVNESDKFFNEFASTIGELLGDDSAPAELRHEVLQLAIVFMCGINQLSPGAYLLRKDLSPAIVSLVKDRETGRFTFEALLLFALLSNFHKSDAAKLNPFVHRIGEISDPEVLSKICWAAEFAASTPAYQQIADDSPPTMTSMIGSFMTSLRPDRAFSSTPVDTPKELFKNQPIEACLVLLPILELALQNRAFLSFIAQSIKDGSGDASSQRPLSHTIISLSSYLVTHATSTSSPRAMGYTNVSLHILLSFVETDEVIRAFCEPSPQPIRLCRQRFPMLPLPPSPRPPICAILDSCILWLRHNLHKRLEAALYVTCLRVCHRTIWFLQEQHIRPEYHWLELWKAAIGLLDFLGGKLDELVPTGSIEWLVQEALVLLDIVSAKADAFLPSPRALHEFVYELVRSAPALRRLPALLRSFISPHATTPAPHENTSEQALSRLLSIVDFYEEKVGTKIRTADGAMRVVAKEVEQDGVHGVRDTYTDGPPSWSEGVTIFLRHAYADGMALMP